MTMIPFPRSTVLRALRSAPAIRRHRVGKIIRVTTVCLLSAGGSETEDIGAELGRRTHRCDAGSELKPVKSGSKDQVAAVLITFPRELYCMCPTIPFNSVGACPITTVSIPQDYSIFPKFSATL